MKKKIIDKGIIKHIAHGMTDSELTPKCNLSGDELRSIFKQLATARAKRVQTLSSDLRSGMARTELMEKYQLSSEALESCLKRLVKLNTISSAELEAYSSSHDEQSNWGFSRSSMRNNPIPAVTIFEVGKPETRYLLRDISENGIGVTGL